MTQRLRQLMRTVPLRWALVCGLTVVAVVVHVQVVTGVAVLLAALCADPSIRRRRPGVEREVVLEAANVSRNGHVHAQASASDVSAVAEVLGHGRSLVDVVARSRADCNDGLSQVQSILDDATKRLQQDFASLHEHVRVESGFVQELAAEIAVHMSEDNERGFQSLATHLKSVLQDAMEQIVRMSTKSVEVVHRFDDMSKNAETMLDMLAESKAIREQTTVLALNATIEAVRAGVHGRTFKTVADEVRALSAKSQVFNDQLEQLTQKLLKSMDATRAAVGEISDCNLEPAVASTRKLDEIVESIQESNASMASGLSRLENSHEVANARLAEAVRALQFEDLARQRIQSVDSEVQRCADFTGRIWDEVSKLGEDGDDAVLEQLLADVRDQVEKWISAAAEEQHIAVGHSDMEEGGVELF